MWFATGRGIATTFAVPGKYRSAAVLLDEGRYRVQSSRYCNNSHHSRKISSFKQVLRSQESPSQVSAVRSVSVIRASQNQLTVEIPKGVGRGNNFAFGPWISLIDFECIDFEYWEKAYADSSMESLTIMEGIVEGMRRRLEQCPIGNLLGTVLIHSLAGGTGYFKAVIIRVAFRSMWNYRSGMGTRLVEIIREEFPENFILSASVLPFDDGDTPLQSYNCLLAMDILQEYVNPYASLSSAGILMLYEKQKRRNADGMILLDNDWFLKRTWRQLTPSSTSRGMQPCTLEGNTLLILFR